MNQLGPQMVYPFTECSRTCLLLLDRLYKGTLHLYQRGKRIRPKILDVVGPRWLLRPQTTRKGPLIHHGSRFQPRIFYILNPQGPYCVFLKVVGEGKVLASLYTHDDGVQREKCHNAVSAMVGSFCSIASWELGLFPTPFVLALELWFLRNRL